MKQVIYLIMVVKRLSRRDKMFVETNEHPFWASLWGRNVIRKSSVANQSNGNIHCVPNGTLGQEDDNNISTNIPSRWDEVVHCGIVEKKISKKNNNVSVKKFNNKKLERK